MRTFLTNFDRIDRRVTYWMANRGVLLLRYSVGIIYVWFGALKLIPNLSPATELIVASMSWMPISMDFFIPFLGLWEIVIGLGFLTGKFLRLTILLMLLQMMGAVSPVLLTPSRIWTQFPFALTLEGQYVIKNLVLVSGALVVGATVRGGGLTEKPEIIALDRPTQTEGTATK